MMNKNPIAVALATTGKPNKRERRALAVALGQMARGTKKTITDDERARRSEWAKQLASIRKPITRSERARRSKWMANFNASRKVEGKASR